MPWQLPQEMQTGDSYGWLNINEHVNFTAYSGEFGEGWRRKFTLPLNEADGTTVTWNIKLIEVSRAMPGVSLYRIEGTFTDVAAISPEFSHRDYRPICTGEINNEPPEYPI
jgi:hypothetical protein